MTNFDRKLRQSPHYVLLRREHFAPPRPTCLPTPAPDAPQDCNLPVAQPGGKDDRFDGSAPSLIGFRMIWAHYVAMMAATSTWLAIVALACFLGAFIAVLLIYYGERGMLP